MGFYISFRCLQEEVFTAQQLWLDPKLNANLVYYVYGWEITQALHHIPKLIETVQVERDFLGAQTMNTIKHLQNHLFISLKSINKTSDHIMVLFNIDWSSQHV